MKWLVSGFAVAGALVLFLVSCGQNYCAIGLIGNCDDMYKNAQNQVGGGSFGGGGPLKIDPAPGQTSICQVGGQKAALQISGGTPPVHMVPNSDVPSGCGQIDENRWDFFVPSGNIPGDCKLQFRDSGNPVQSYDFHINVKAQGNC